MKQFIKYILKKVERSFVFYSKITDMLFKSPGPYLWILFLMLLFLFVWICYANTFGGFGTLEYKGKALNVLMLPLLFCSFFAVSSWTFGDWVNKNEEAKEPEDRKAEKPNE